MPHNNCVKGSLGWWCVGTFCLAVGTATAFRGLDQGRLLAGMLLIVGIGAWLALLAHELGHAAAARLQRFEICSIWVMGVFVYRRKPRFKTPPGFLGVVIASKAGATAKEWAVVFAAGPLASLAVGIPTAIWMRQHRPSPGSVQEIAAFSLCAGVVYITLIVFIGGLTAVGDFNIL